MKELFWIPIILAVFAFGYYMITKVEHFVWDKKLLLFFKKKEEKNRIRIAAENRTLLDAVVPTLEECFTTEPKMEFLLSRGEVNRILRKLLKEQLDIVILTAENIGLLNWKYESLRIPYRGSEDPEEAADLKEVYVIWKKDVKSKSRDRVIFALENEYGSLKTGYADYLK